MDEQYEGRKKDRKNKIKIKNNGIPNKEIDYVWPITILIWTFIFSIILNFTSIVVLNNVGVSVAFIVLMLIILLGVVFDTIGIAVTVASETPFHSMASRRVPGARYAVKLIRNAEKVSNFCNDVVGDIAGIISGVTSATIVVQIAAMHSITDTVIIGIFITATVAALTVGGKSIGKSIAILKSNAIVYKVSLIIYHFKKIFSKKKI